MANRQFFLCYNLSGSYFDFQSDSSQIGSLNLNVADHFTDLDRIKMTRVAISLVKENTSEYILSSQLILRSRWHQRWPRQVSPTEKILVFVSDQDLAIQSRVGDQGSNCTNELIENFCFQAEIINKGNLNENKDYNVLALCIALRTEIFCNLVVLQYAQPC